MKTSNYLNYYAEHFACAEINTSFYRLPGEETITSWVEKVPKGFKFCPKMSRYLTHMKKLREPEEPLERFFNLFEPMKAMLGPVLVQLPPMAKFYYDVAEHLFKLFRKKYKAYEFVIEPRHATWFENDALNLMAKYGIGLVISQSGAAFPYSEMITAKNIYIRFHGPAELYASSYSDEMLKTFLKKIKAWVKEGHEVWIFFNNDIHGHAFRDAARLIKMI